LSKVNESVCGQYGHAYFQVASGILRPTVVCSKCGDALEIGHEGVIMLRDVNGPQSATASTASDGAEAS
jgi:hypothetical protein